jgi:hypothetical protein
MERDRAVCCRPSKLRGAKYQGDIATGKDALTLRSYGPCDAIITNPPYERAIKHALISHFQATAPTWLLIEWDWIATKQAIPYLVSCTIS